MYSDLAQRRILRLAFGTTLGLWLSQMGAWPLSFIAPVLVTVILGLPLPAPTFRTGLKLVGVIAVALHAGLLILPSLLRYPPAGVLLLALALYWTFYFTSRGGSPLVGTLATLGIGIGIAVGTYSLDLFLMVVKGVIASAALAVMVVWAAHALLPEPRPPRPAPAPPVVATPDLPEARRSAFRSLAVVLPVALFIVLSPSGISYLAVMIKVAAMGQEATNEDTKVAARSLLASTLIGGVAAIIGWKLLSVAPSLVLYSLLVGLAGLVIGARIFQGGGMHPSGATWSYGYLTMLVILAPAVTDSLAGGPAGAKFIDRLLMFAFAACYAVLAVFVFDMLWPSKTNRSTQGFPASP